MAGFAESAAELIKDAASAVVVAGVIPAGFFVALKMTGLDKIFNAARGKGRELFAKTSMGRRMDARAKGKEASRQARALDLESRAAAGNYRGWNPYLRGRSAANAARAKYGVGGRRLGEQIIQDRALRSKERQNVIAEFNGDTDLAQAWAESGGGRNTSVASYQRLKAPQKEAFRQLRMSGRHQSAESFLAAQQMLATEGEGNYATLTAAKSYAKQLGASDPDLGALEQVSLSGWRKEGRGDIQEIADIDPRTGAYKTLGWGAVRPESISRKALKTPAQQAEFLKWYSTSDTTKASVIGALKKMEGRSRSAVIDVLGGDAAIDAERARLRGLGFQITD